MYKKGDKVCLLSPAHKESTPNIWRLLIVREDYDPDLGWVRIKILGSDYTNGYMLNNIGYYSETMDLIVNGKKN